MKKNVPVIQGGIIPADLVPIFNPPPLLSSEDPKVYCRILVGLAEDVQPVTVTEWLLVKDIADLNWEMRRMRRWKSAVLETTSTVEPDRTRDDNVSAIRAEQNTRSLMAIRRARLELRALEVRPFRPHRQNRRPRKKEQESRKRPSNKSMPRRPKYFGITSTSATRSKGKWQPWRQDEPVFIVNWSFIAKVGPCGGRRIRSSMLSLAKPRAAWRSNKVTQAVNQSMGQRRIYP